MKLLELNTKQCVVNLFADYILKKIGQTTETIISVANLNDMVICINGVTETSTILDLQELKEEFNKEYSEICETTGFDKIVGLIDLVTYESKPTSHSRWFSFRKDGNSLIEITNNDDNFLQITSKFPHGHSLSVGRELLYYSEYIAHNILIPTYSDKIDIRITKNKLDEFDQEIYLKTYSKYYSTDKIKSLILDIFDFNFEEFSVLLNEYDIMNDLLNSTQEKPWHIKDKHPNDLIIF